MAPPSRARRRAVKPAPLLTVLWHADPRRVGDRAWLRDRTTPLSRLEPAFGEGDAAAPLADPFLSRRPIEIVDAGTLGWTLRAGGTSTALRVDGAVVPDTCTVPAARLDDGVVLELSDRVALLLHRRRPRAPTPGDPLGLVGHSEAIEVLRRTLGRVATLTGAVLLSGETGSGKELVARALHAAGPRAAGPFVAVNMAAVAPTLAASTLFGHCRGAFSGATAAHDGIFARADGGTLFMDEIGDTPPDVQPMLLRALESGEITPVGGRDPRAVDVRLVAATDVDLAVAADEGRFRAPLLHRVAGFEVRVPPLRARREDVAHLTLHFARALLDELGERDRVDAPDPRAPWLPAPVVAALARAPWPGNVRQLRNVVRQLLTMHLDADVVDHRGELERLIGAPPADAPPSVQRPASAIEPDTLRAALRAARYELKATARALGISRTALYGLIERTPGVRTAAALSADEVRAAHAACGGDLDAMVAQLEVSAAALRRRLREIGQPG
ncbi:MAG: sigma-54-dependent Fis family transcriptional regulator [Myxococcales bacterium]|nr:sigma-54-dependent Fis family transcriptional regulator [Myxococcales bacterium]